MPATDGRATIFSIMFRLPRILLHPFETGAIAPSSSRLARRVVETADVGKADRVIELGPGNGAITRRLLHALPENARLLAVERDPESCDRLAAAHPGITIACSCATCLESIAGKNAFLGADRVVSALPWTNLPREAREDIVRAIHRILCPGGRFLTISCAGLHWLPQGRHLRRLLDAAFEDVFTTPVVFGNVPPAFIYVCRKTASVLRNDASGNGSSTDPRHPTP